MRAFAVLFPFFVAVAALAQESPHAEPGPIEGQLVSPDTLMHHQEELGLEEAQKTEIRELVHKAQAEFVDLQWKLEQEQERLGKLLRASPVDRAASLAQADKVMGIEHDIKRAHLAMLIDVKNVLTAEQVEKAMALRRAHDAAHEGGAR